MSPACGCGAVTRLAGIAQVDARAQGHKPGSMRHRREALRSMGWFCPEEHTPVFHQAQLGTRPADRLKVQCLRTPGLERHLGGWVAVRMRRQHTATGNVTWTGTPAVSIREGPFGSCGPQAAGGRPVCSLPPHSQSSWVGSKLPRESAWKTEFFTNNRINTNGA